MDQLTMYDGKKLEASPSAMLPWILEIVLSKECVCSMVDGAATGLEIVFELHLESAYPT
jgi:hypothetical protein